MSVPLNSPGPYGCSTAEQSHPRFSNYISLCQMSSLEEKERENADSDTRSQVQVETMRTTE